LTLRNSRFFAPCRGRLQCGHFAGVLFVGARYIVPAVAPPHPGLCGWRSAGPPFMRGKCEKTRWHRLALSLVEGHSCLCTFANPNKFTFREATCRCQIAPFWVFSQLRGMSGDFLSGSATLRASRRPIHRRGDPRFAGHSFRPPGHASPCRGATCCALLSLPAFVEAGRNLSRPCREPGSLSAAFCRARALESV